jgi:3-oxoacyl-[acyl-carrier-protein] synthase-3
MAINYKVSKKKISGIVSVVPKHTVKFSDEISNYGFSKEKCINLQETIGFNERRIVADGECGSDLCMFGIEYLLNQGLLNRDEIGAIVYVTQTPDHFMPPTSTILHGKLRCPRDVLCFDINHGCAGYVYGLIQAFLLLSIVDKKILLLNGDTLSRRSCPYDRNIYPIIGDAGSVTIIENTNSPNDIYFNVQTDGTRSNWLMIPAGGFRQPSTDLTREIKVLSDGNRRSDDDFYMNGAGIFTFTQTDVPVAIKDLFQFAQKDLDGIDYFMFHQPNRFMLQKMAKKLNVPEQKMPNNIVEKFGNSSSVCIPVNICHNIADIVLREELSICMSGFGVGLSWGTIIMNLGPLEFCSLIEK